MNRVARLRVRTIEKMVDVLVVLIVKAGGLQRGPHRFEVLSPNQNIEVSCVSRGRFVHPAHPGRHGVSSRDRVGNSALLQGGDGAQQSIFDFFHSPDHPVEGNRAKLDGHDFCLE